MSMVLHTREFIFWESAVVLVSYLVHLDTFLPNVTDIYIKCNSDYNM